MNNHVLYHPSILTIIIGYHLQKLCVSRVSAEIDTKASSEIEAAEGHVHAVFVRGNFVCVGRQQFSCGVTGTVQLHSVLVMMVRDNG